MSVNFKDTIRYQVTNPASAATSDDHGCVIVPSGFPVRNVSGWTGCDESGASVSDVPLQYLFPDFVAAASDSASVKITYNSPVECGTLYGNGTFPVKVSSASWDGTSVTFVTSVVAGYAAGMTIACVDGPDGSSMDSWSAHTYSVTSVSGTSVVAVPSAGFTYVPIGTTVLYVSFSVSDGDIVGCMNQTAEADRGVYRVVTSSGWLRVSNGIPAVTYVATSNVTFGSAIPGVSAGLVALSAQDTASENGVYLYDGVSLSSSDRYGDLLSFNGTENDNVAGCLSVDHFRHGYSDSEVAGWLKSALGYGMLASRFAGDERSLSESGFLIRWLLGCGYVSISDPAQGYAVNIPCFCKGRPSELETAHAREYPSYDSLDASALAEKRSRRKFSSRLTRWEIGANSSARIPGSAHAALVNDWPYAMDASLTMNNNIVLAVDRTYTDESGVVRHSVTGRHFVSVWHDMTTESDGGVAFKKTFIHLPTPLSLRDGETVELAVSVPTLNTDAAFSGYPQTSAGRTAALETYKNLVTQPRAMVISGHQSFGLIRGETGYVCETPVDSYSVAGTDPESTVSLTLSRHVLDSSGSDLTASEIRFSITSTVYPEFRYDYTGSISGGVSVNGTGPFPVRPSSESEKTALLKSLRVSGIAYIRETDAHGADTAGLTERSNVSAMYKPEVTYADRLYNTEDSIVGSTAAESSWGKSVKDRRVVIAAVYPTATSTFALRITGRPKMHILQTALTLEGDRGKYAPSAAAHAKNLITLSKYYGSAGSSYAANGFSPADVPVTYSTSRTGEASCAGYLTRVILPESITADIAAKDYPYSSFTAQAGRAFSELISDWQRGRVAVSESDDIPSSLPDSANASVFTPSAHSGLSSFDYASFVSGGNSKLDDFNDLFDSHSVKSARRAMPGFTDVEDGGAVAWSTRLEMLPRISVDSEGYTARPVGDPYGGPGAEISSVRAENLLYTLSAGYDPYSVTERDMSVPCDLSPSSAYLGVPYGKTSVVRALMEHTQIKSKTQLDDLIRLSDSICHWLPAKFRNGASYFNAGEYPEGLTCMSAFSPAASVDPFLYPDSVPVQGIDETDEYKDAVSGCPLAEWSLLYRNADGTRDSAVPGYLNYVSSEQSDARGNVSAALCSFLRTYAAPRAAFMPCHFYDSFKMIIEDPTSGNEAMSVDATRKFRHSVTFFVEKNGSGCGDGFVTQYLNDNFMEITGTDTASDSLAAHDYNLSSFTYGSYVDAYRGGSPFGFGREWLSKKICDTYTRVHMTFVFSRSAGRWYTVDYRQIPGTYLSPLYGAKALGTVMPSYVYPGKNPMLGGSRVPVIGGSIAAGTYPVDASGNTVTDRLWKNSACNLPADGTASMKVPYSEMPPMEMNIGCIPFMYGKSSDADFPFTAGGKLKAAYSSSADSAGAGLHRLSVPEATYDDGGINLYPPSDMNGGAPSVTPAISAAPWQVRWDARPAVSCLGCTVVPSVTSRTGGSMSDSTLWGQFDYPVKGTANYSVPDPNDPDKDLLSKVLINEVPENLSSAEGEDLTYED